MAARFVGAASCGCYARARPDAITKAGVITPVAGSWTRIFTKKYCTEPNSKVWPPAVDQEPTAADASARVLLTSHALDMSVAIKADVQIR